MDKHIRILVQLLIDLIIAIGILIVIQSQLITLTKVFQWSMYDTLSEGDLLITEKVSYRFNKPNRGDIVILLGNKPQGFEGTRMGILLDDYIRATKNQEARTRYVKRVIGLPGDVVTMTEGKVYINGELLEEEYAIGETKSHSLLDAVVVPEGQVFVLGDNRECSMDSRYFGCVPLENIESRVVCKVWPQIEWMK